jgi:hypothetical protein
MARGMYAPLSTSFVNLAASRGYKIYNLLPKESKESFYNLYHEEYAEKLGFETKDASDYFDGEVCKFVLNVQMYTHSEYLKRVSRGAKTETRHMPQNIDIAKKKRRIRNFFLKFSKKKNKSSSQI